jgi:hypothetical protein
MVGNWVDSFVTKAALTYLSKEKKLLKDLAGDNKEQLKLHTSLLEDLEASTQRLYSIQDMYLEGKTSQAEYERARKKLGAKHQELQREIDLLEAKRSPKVVFESENIERVWEEKTIEEKRAILRVIIQEIRIKKATNLGSNLPDWNRIEIIWRK